MIRQDWSTLKKLMFAKTAAGSKAVEDTATGNPLTFLTDLAKPLKSLLIPFTPQQTGSGDPSPVNIRPIVPWNGLKVGHNNINLLNPLKIIREDGYTIGYDGTISESATSGYTDNFFDVQPNKTYTVYGDGVRVVAQYTENGTFVSRGEGKNTPITFTTSATIKKIRLQYRLSDFNPSSVVLVEGDTIPTTPTTYNISFPSPVYGGEHEAISGAMKVKWRKETFTKIRDILTSSGKRLWRIDLSVNGIPTTSLNRSNYFAEEYVSNVGAVEGNIYITGTNGNVLIVVPHADQQELSTKEDVETWLANNPIVYCYPLATPQEIQLTTQQITALVGNNTIWSDADGSMTAVYLKKG